MDKKSHFQGKHLEGIYLLSLTFIFFYPKTQINVSGVSPFYKLGMISSMVEDYSILNWVESLQETKSLMSWKSWHKSLGLLTFRIWRCDKNKLLVFLSHCELSFQPHGAK